MSEDRLKGRNAEEVDRLKDFIAKEERRDASRKANAQQQQQQLGKGKGEGGEPNKRGGGGGVWRKGKFVTQEDEANVAKKDKKYRDRAAERREGANPDYKDSEELLAVVQFDTEKSKFLGGDLEHTHLVKGLDYALLQRAKRETAAQQQKGDQDYDGSSARPAPRKPSASKLGAAQEIEANTYSGKALLAALKALQGKTVPLDIGLVAYEFNLKAESDAMPTVLARPKGEGWGGEGRSMPYVMDDDLLAKFSERLAHSHHKGKKRKSKPETVPGGPAASSSPPSFDMFEGIEIGKPEAKGKAERSGGVFAGLAGAGAAAGDEDHLESEISKDEIAKSIKQVAIAAARKQERVEKATLGKASLAAGEYEDFVGAGDANFEGSDDEELTTTVKKRPGDKKDAGDGAKKPRP
jgi:hypothetical protein